MVDLNRDFEGMDLRWTRQTELASRPFTFTAGINYDNLDEHRKGFTNVAGQIGLLRRDEDDTVFDFDQFMQAQWDLTDRWSVSGGVRHSVVKYESEDHFITGTNGDDSGSIQFSKTTPVAGVVFKVNPVFNLYANAGKGFETPTFAELAYKSVSATSTGLNFALKPAESTNYEIGAKTYLGTSTRLNAAVFKTDTKNEIVVLLNNAGRSVFQNVDSSSREGFELAVDSAFGNGFTALLSYTLLNAKFDNAFLTCGTSTTCTVPNIIVPAGNKIPGVPSNSVYGELGWSYSPLGFATAVEGRWVDKVFVNDLNSESADAYTLVNLRASFEQKFGGWKISEFARVDNIFDKEYVGSVIVNASAGQYYEPAPGTSYTIGGSVSYRF